MDKANGEQVSYSIFNNKKKQLNEELTLKGLIT